MRKLSKMTDQDFIDWLDALEAGDIVGSPEWKKRKRRERREATLYPWLAVVLMLIFVIWVMSCPSPAS